MDSLHQIVMLLPNKTHRGPQFEALFRHIGREVDQLRSQLGIRGCSAK